MPSSTEAGNHRAETATPRSTGEDRGGKAAKTEKSAAKIPLVAEIKRNSLDDGPGIRSVVFFKGCPLRCVWCHNPECIHPGQEILFRAQTCIGCSACEKICPERAIGPGGPASLDHRLCTLCGLCTGECPSGALTLVGTAYTAEELVRFLAQDKAFYENSGGGVTLSGGEPTLVLDFSAEVAARLRALGIRVLLETCGDFDWERFEAKLLPHLDQVYVDLKLVDEEAHRRHTGRSNRRIRKNIRNLVRVSRPPTLVRLPLIPGITATRDNLQETAGWLWKEGIRRIALLPYNPLWIAKARGLGQPLRYDRDTWMSKEERQEVREIFAGFDLEREI